MTIFTSGTQALQGRTVSHDPKPRVFNGMRYYVHEATEGMPYAPRPEYAVLDNPILADFRKHYPEQSARSWVRVLWMPNARRRFWLGEDYSLDQIDHARRVLTRLAAWSVTA